jgi:hypothetical protein
VSKRPTYASCAIIVTTIAKGAVLSDAGGGQCASTVSNRGSIPAASRSAQPSAPGASLVAQPCLPEA